MPSDPTRASHEMRCIASFDARALAFPRAMGERRTGVFRSIVRARACARAGRDVDARARSRRNAALYEVRFFSRHRNVFIGHSGICICKLSIFNIFAREISLRLSERCSMNAMLRLK